MDDINNSLRSSQGKETQLKEELAELQRKFNSQNQQVTDLKLQLNAAINTKDVSIAAAIPISFQSIFLIYILIYLLWNKLMS